jgi:hypothetical protein
MSTIDEEAWRRRQERRESFFDAPPTNTAVQSDRTRRTSQPQSGPSVVRSRQVVEAPSSSARPDETAYRRSADKRRESGYGDGNVPTSYDQIGENRRQTRSPTLSMATHAGTSARRPAGQRDLSRDRFDSRPEGSQNPGAQADTSTVRRKSALHSGQRSAGAGSNKKVVVIPWDGVTPGPRHQTPEPLPPRRDSEEDTDPADTGKLPPEFRGLGRKGRKSHRPPRSDQRDHRQSEETRRREESEDRRSTERRSEERRSEERRRRNSELDRGRTSRENRREPTRRDRPESPPGTVETMINYFKRHK